MSRNIESITGGYRGRIPIRDLITMTVVANILGKDVEHVIFPSTMESPWICFDCDGRRFGIWRRTHRLFEADKYGAMGDDPVDLLDPEALKK